MAAGLASLDHPPPPSNSLFDGLPVAILSLDAAETITAANVRAYQVFGLSTLAGANFAAVIHQIAGPDERPAATLLRMHEQDEVELVLVSTDERVLCFRIQRGGTGGWSVCVDDVTRHRRDGASDHRDALTNLTGRKEFEARVGAALAAVARSGGEAALLCLDLDRFKAVNDTLGHPTGDALLKMVAQRLRSAVREEDVVARLGGDEFAILQVGDEQPEGAAALAKRLVDLVGRTYVAHGHMLNVGVSVGVTILPRDGTDTRAALRNADLALYRAKAEGRGTFCFFEPEMDARMQARRDLELDLRKALALKEFALVYQPQHQLEGNVLTGFEALLRWHHPERGFVSPVVFIPLAEEIGLMPAIGDWVLRTACREAMRWPEAVSVAVNVSAMQFRRGKLLESVTLALAATGLPPRRLELEITEGALLDDTPAVLTTLNALRELGCRVSMDDFGTGYSSLSYLQKFPFDRIKIDQSFVRGMDSKDSLAIIRAVASLGASLGMTTVAEGVETLEQLALIQAEGCTDAQGYLISRPLNPEAAFAFITQRPTHVGSATTHEPAGANP